MPAREPDPGVARASESTQVAYRCHKDIDLPGTLSGVGKHLTEVEERRIPANHRGCDKNSATLPRITAADHYVGAAVERVVEVPTALEMEMSRTKRIGGRERGGVRGGFGPRPFVISEPVPIAAEL